MPGVYNTGHKVCSLALTGLNMPEDLINFLLAAPGTGTPPRALPRAAGARAGHWPRAAARAFKEGALWPRCSAVPTPVEFVPGKNYFGGR